MDFTIQHYIIQLNNSAEHMPLLLPATSNSKLKPQVNKIGHRKTTTTHKRKISEATQNKITQFKPKSNLRYGKIFGNNDNQQSSKRTNLNGPSSSQNFNVNQISSTPKDWFEQLQLLPVLFIKEDKVFDTYALIDPGSQFTFLLDAVFEYTELPRKYQSSTTVQYLSVEYEMPLSKKSNQ